MEKANAENVAKLVKNNQSSNDRKTSSLAKQLFDRIEVKKITRITDKQETAISVAEIKIKGLSQLVQQTNKISSAQKKFDDEHN